MNQWLKGVCVCYLMPDPELLSRVKPVGYSAEGRGAA